MGGQLQIKGGSSPTGQYIFVFFWLLQNPIIKNRKERPIKGILEVPSIYIGYLQRQKKIDLLVERTTALRRVVFFY